MNKIQMFDAKQDYLAHKQEIDYAISQVLNSGKFIRDYCVDKLEFELSRYFGSYVVTCGNGTDALQIALMALGLEEGDEIITTPFTFVATVEVIMLLKLKPVFVDINSYDFTIDSAQIEKAITRRTRAIIPVHLFGACCDMGKIKQIADKYNLYIIEDVCQSLGTIWNSANNFENDEFAGTIGDIGCTSFFPTKNLGGYGDGGAIFVRDKELFERVRMIANHGSRIKYFYETVGVNSRLDEIQAAILSVKLKYLKNYIFKRRYVAEKYNKLLDENFIPLIIPRRILKDSKIDDRYLHTFNQYTIRIKNRNKLKSYLSSYFIPSMIYYPLPLHLHDAYKCLGYKEGDFPVSELMSKEVLSLPMHPYLEEDKIEYITSTIKKFLET